MRVHEESTTVTASSSRTERLLEYLVGLAGVIVLLLVVEVVLTLLILVRL